MLELIRPREQVCTFKADEWSQQYEFANVSAT